MHGPPITRAEVSARQEPTPTPPPRCTARPPPSSPLVDCASRNAEAHRHPFHPHRRLRADRHRPGLRVRLFGHPGLPRAQARGLPGRAGELQPGHDHDRPGVRRRHLRRAADCPSSSRRSSRRSAPTRCCRRSAARPASTSRSRSTSAARSSKYGVEVLGAEHRGAQARRGPPALQAGDGGDRPQRAAQRLRRHPRGGARDRRRDRPAADRAPELHPRRRGRRHRLQPRRARRRRRARARRQPGAADPDRAVGARLEGVRARGHARPRRQRDRRLLGRERRRHGRPHRRLDHRRAAADALRPRVPGDARRRLQGDPPRRRRHRRLQHPVRRRPARPASAW